MRQIPSEAGGAGQLVTVDVGDVPDGTEVTIRIQCTVRETAPGGHEIVNRAVLVSQDPSLVYRPRRSVEVEEEFVPETDSLLLLASGLAGPGTYAGKKAPDSSGIAHYRSESFRLE